jgi:hypothetical protein
MKESGQEETDETKVRTRRRTRSRRGGSGGEAGDSGQSDEEMQVTPQSEGMSETSEGSGKDSN